MVVITFDLDEMEDELGEAAMQIAEDVAVELANQLRIEAPVGATGRLQGSFQLFRTEDNVIYLGTRVPYAKGVWKGKPPHEPDFQALQKWARRKLGDESAAGPVFAKIKREGTEPNDYVGRAVDNTLERVGQMRFDQL
jgi:hypothetical protein